MASGTTFGKTLHWRYSVLDLILSLITMWPYPKLVAHRGGGTLAPENTLAALRYALDAGVQAVEFDVMLSKDGVPVVMHDTELGRTVAGKGKVSDFTAQELTGMDAGSWFHSRYASERVPTYAQFFDFCTKHRIWMNVEIKPVPGFEEETGRVVAQYTRHFLQHAFGPDAWHADILAMPMFSSFSFEALMAAKEEAPEIPRGMLLRAMPMDWEWQLKQLEAIAIDISYRSLTAKQVQAAKQAGYGIFCYTVNDVEKAKELYAWGVDAICTDRIDLFDAGMRSELQKV